MQELSQKSALNPLEKALHLRALNLAGQYRKSETDLIDILQKIDEKKVFEALKYKSLFQYVLSELKLSESIAFSLITVARKSIKVPELKMELQAGHLTLSKATRIVSVINPQNSQEWLNKAKTMTKDKLEKEIAKVDPKTLPKEKSRYVTEDCIKIEGGIHERVHQKMQRVKELLSQKIKRSPTFEEIIDAMADSYLEHEDPVVKAKRVLAKKSVRADKLVCSGRVPSEKNENQAEILAATQEVSRVADPKVQGVKTLFRQPIPAQIKHEVFLRDDGQCDFVDTQGKRCDERKWLHLHHKTPVSQGGGNQTDNLQLLCFGHLTG